MARLGDIVLLGPRVTLSVGGAVLRRLRSIGGEPQGETSETETLDASRPETEAFDVPQRVGGGFPEPPGKDPGDRSRDPSPHHSLSTPVGEADPTEWPDPYERREDPRYPPDPDEEPFGEEPHPAVGSESTSEPHPDADIEAPQTNPPQRDKLDE